MEQIELNENNGQQRKDMALDEEDIAPIASRGQTTPNPFTRRHSSIDLDDYFVSPHPPLSSKLETIPFITYQCVEWSS